MKRILTLSLGAVLVVGAALALHAQGPDLHHRMGPGGPGMMHGGSLSDHFDFMAKALDLNDEQKAAAKKLVADLEAQAKPLMEQRHQEMDAVHDLLEGANPDPTEVGRRVIAAHATMEKLAALHEDFMTKVSAILTPEQLEKAKKLHEMHGERGHFGEREPGF
jgi:Spy/CpxP family protein refolding chaperone